MLKSRHKFILNKLVSIFQILEVPSSKIKTDFCMKIDQALHKNIKNTLAVNSGYFLKQICSYLDFLV